MNRLLILGVVACSLLANGCYYSHLASGQIKMIWSREPITDVLQDPATEPRTAALLKLVAEARGFATDLGLDVGEQYTSFVAWPGDRIVTTLVRTPMDSVEAIPFWFPLLGELPYKGYFDRERAEKAATTLRENHGYDVCVSGVSAYSTLGWIDDPVTSPMLRRGPASLVETILHELVHVNVFLPGEADFNESVAQFIGQEAAARFFDRAPAAYWAGSGLDWPAAEHVRKAVLDRRRIGAETSAFRTELAELFETSAAGPSSSAKESLAAIETLRAEGRARLAALPLLALDAERIAERTRLTNACLALRSAYVEDLPRHARVLSALGGDLRAMIKRLRRIAEEELGPDAFYDVSPDDPSPPKPITQHQRPSSSTTPS